MTLERLWNQYEAYKANIKSIDTDKGRFQRFLMPDFGNKEPHKIIRLDVDRLRVRLLKN